MNAWNPDRDPHGRFAPGSGGRPLGACNRSGRKVRETLERSLDLHLADALEEVRRRDPATYLRLLLRAVPPARHDVGDFEELSPGQLADRLRDFAAWLAAAGYAPLPSGENGCSHGQADAATDHDFPATSDRVS